MRFTEFHCYIFIGIMTIKYVLGCIVSEKFIYWLFDFRDVPIITQIAVSRLHAQMYSCGYLLLLIHIQINGAVNLSSMIMLRYEGLSYNMYHEQLNIDSITRSTNLSASVFPTSFAIKITCSSSESCIKYQFGKQIQKYIKKLLLRLVINI